MPKNKLINIGIIGLGYWGPNYIKSLSGLPGSKIKYCCDLDEKNWEKVKEMCPGAEFTKDYKKIAKDSQIDAVIIATPPDSHHQIAKYLLNYQKHLLIEKPLTSSVREAEELIKVAKRNGQVLMVGHIYLFNPGVRKLKRVLEKKELGEVYYLSAERLGLGPIRKKGGALRDLAAHDISVALYLLEESPIKISIEGGSYIQKGVEDYVCLNLKFPNNVFYTIYASWFAPEKVRRLTIVGSDKMAVFDDLNKNEMVKIYERKIDKGLLDSTPDYNDHQNVVTIGDVYVPEIKQSEPLKNQINHFLECILGNKEPLSSGRNGLDVVRILELAEKKLKRS